MDIDGLYMQLDDCDFIESIVVLFMYYYRVILRFVLLEVDGVVIHMYVRKLRHLLPAV